jgi:hypothetical protein
VRRLVDGGDVAQHEDRADLDAAGAVERKHPAAIDRGSVLD